MKLFRDILTLGARFDIAGGGFRLRGSFCKPLVVAASQWPPVPVSVLLASSPQMGEVFTKRC